MKKFLAIIALAVSFPVYADTYTKVDNNTVTVQRSVTQQVTITGYNAEIKALMDEKTSTLAHKDGLTVAIAKDNARVTAINDRLAVVRAEKVACIAAGADSIPEQP